MMISEEHVKLLSNALALTPSVHKMMGLGRVFS